MKGQTARTPRRSAWLAWALWVVAVALALVGGLLLVLTLDADVPDTWGFRGYWVILAPIVATPGLLIALRQPRNAIGWLLLVAALADGYGGFAQEYATYAVIAHPGSLPGAVALAWVNSSWSVGIFAGTLLLLVPLLFPTGQPLTSRWRPVVWGATTFIVVTLVVFGLRPGPLENAPFVDNPIVSGGPIAELRAVLVTPLTLYVAGLVIASGASAIVRFRRSRGIVRQQLKWVALSAVLIAAAMLGVLATQSPGGGTNTSKPAQAFMIFAFATLPVAIGVAMLRYRLYDIDLIINRTIVYGALSAGLGASYVAFVVVLQAVLRPITGGSEIAVAASTLAVVALAQPARRRIQDQVDRLFYRSRYDAGRTLDAFASRLRDEVDLTALDRDLVDIVDQTLSPSHARLWLRVGR